MYSKPEVAGMRMIVAGYSDADLVWIVRKLRAEDPRDNPRWRGIPLSILLDEQAARSCAEADYRIASKLTNNNIDRRAGAAIAKATGGES